MQEHRGVRGSEWCWRVERQRGAEAAGGVVPLPGEEAASGPLVRVEAAGFNYKDALACAGHPGVARELPLIPGIDAAGTLLEPVGGLPAGAAVVVTGNGLGETRPGAFATLLRPPPEAIVTRPAALSAVAAMSLGTAGLTVLLALDRIARVAPPRNAPAPDAAWLVTGASGGVGMIAVAALAASGRRVVACSRKAPLRATLAALGAESVVAPEDLHEDAGKPLLRGRWAGVIDTVGGTILADALRAVSPGGVVAAVGMAGGVELPTTVYPFILRGVTLCGIDAASLPTQAERAALWPRLAELWPRLSGTLPVTTLALDEVGDWSEALLAGTAYGRAVVLPGARARRHSISLVAAWEPEGEGTNWRRRFGRPASLEPGATVRLVVVNPGTGTVALNGIPLPDLRGGLPSWSFDVTHLLRDRNELVLVPAARSPASNAARGRPPLPENLGNPVLEIVTRACDS